MCQLSAALGWKPETMQGIAMRREIKLPDAKK